MFSKVLLVLCAAGCSLASGQNPLISTPCGLRPAACVRQSPVGGQIKFAPEEHPADFHILHANGTHEWFTVPSLCHEFAAHGGLAPTKPTISQDRAAISDGWVESAGVYRMDPSSTISKFTGQWTVPPAPTKPERPETLYYFIGLEDRTQGKLTTIHQPVLTWGDQTEGGQYNNSWHLWSWTCCPKNLTWHSEDIAGFNPGDTIFGSIEKTSADVWRIDGAFKEADGKWRNTTLVSQVGGFVYNYADVTMEIYNITNCDQMASGSAAFDQLALTLSDGSSWVPNMWYVTGFSTSCNTKMKVHNSSSMVITSNI